MISEIRCDGKGKQVHLAGRYQSPDLIYFVTTVFLGQMVSLGSVYLTLSLPSSFLEYDTEEGCSRQPPQLEVTENQHI